MVREIFEAGMTQLDLQGGDYYSGAATTLGFGFGFGTEVAPLAFFAALLSGTDNDERCRAFEAASFVFAASSLSFLPALR
jgi:hypothetical protein